MNESDASNEAEQKTSTDFKTMGNGEMEMIGVEKIKKTGDTISTITSTSSTQKEQKDNDCKGP